MRQKGVVLYKNPTLLLRGGKAIVVGYDIRHLLKKWLGIHAEEVTVNQGNSPLFTAESTEFALTGVNIECGYNGEIYIIKRPRSIIIRKTENYSAEILIATEIAVKTIDDYTPHGTYLIEILGVREKVLRPGEHGYVVEYNIETKEISRLIANHSWSYEYNYDEEIEEEVKKHFLDLVKEANFLNLVKEARRKRRKRKLKVYRDLKWWEECEADDVMYREKWLDNLKESLGG